MRSSLLKARRLLNFFFIITSKLCILPYPSFCFGSVARPKLFQDPRRLMHLPVSTPKKGRSCWYFAVYGSTAFSVDWVEAGALGAGALGADGWESFTFVISRCMSKEVWSALIVPDPWMCILSKPSDAVDGHNINNSIKMWVLQIHWIGGVAH